MKKILLALMAVIVSVDSYSQSRLVTATYQKTPQPAIETEIPFPEKTVSDAIDDKLQKSGYKGKEGKGFVVYKGVRLSEIGPDTYDLYFGTDRKSKKEKDITKVTMMVSSGYEKFIGDTTNAVIINYARRYMDSLTSVVAAYDLEQQITEQESVVKKADKKMVNLVDDGHDLLKKKAKLEREIEENMQEQTSQKTELEKQQQILTNLKAKRK